ncbi:MAG: hypothetical protein ACYS0D_16305, partial [Planctomycetota bacterium]
MTPDGRRAAVALILAIDKRDVSSEIRVYDMDRAEPVNVPVSGFVRDLLYLEGSSGLFGIEHHPAKRHEGDSYLVRVDLETRKPRREKRLPPSARGLDYWAAGRSLLVAARNEVRTVTLPLLRSGPLFRVLGENYSVAAVGGTRILVGQAAALLLIDLSDTQQREGMPVRQRIASSSPVLDLAVAADGSRGVARLADDSVVAVGVDPLALEVVGTGLVLDRGAEEPPPLPPLVAEVLAPPETAMVELPST